MSSMLRAQSPCGANVLVSRPNQLTPLIWTTRPSASTMLPPSVRKGPAPNGSPPVAACADAVDALPIGNTATPTSAPTSTAAVAIPNNLRISDDTTPPQCAAPQGL